MICRLLIRLFCRSALTEVCVLADVLSVAKQKRYMILDPVPQNEPMPQPKDIAQIYARKKVSLKNVGLASKCTVKYHRSYNTYVAYIHPRIIQ